MKRFLADKAEISASPEAVKALQETAQAEKFVVWFNVCENTSAVWFSHLQVAEEYENAKTPAEWLVF